MNPIEIRTTLVLVTALSAGGLATIAEPGSASSEDDWTVTSDLVLADQTRQVTGVVVIETGATLHLKGSILWVGDHIVVEDGGTLLLEPHSGRPSQLLPADPSTGFWARVNGTIQSRGLPASIIRGINGDGFSTFFEPTGGLKIAGIADLEDVELTSSRAGLLIDPTGEVTLRNATVRRFGFTGIMGEGRVRLDNVSLTGHNIGITGRGRCEFIIQNSRLSNFAANLQINGCPSRIENSTLLNASKSIVMNGHARLTVENTSIEGYDTYGIAGHGNSRIELRNSTITAGFRGEDIDYQRGVELRPNNWLIVDNSTIQGNYQDGINAQSSTLEIKNSSFWTNRRFGVFLYGGGFDGDPLRTNDFGSTESGTQNQGGAISARSKIKIRLLDQDNRSLPGVTVTVTKKDTSEMVFSETASPNRTVIASFESYGINKDKQPIFLGPFVYTVSHPYLEKPISGLLNVNQEEIELQIVPESSFDSRNLVATGVLVVAAGLLISAGYFSGPIRRAGLAWLQTFRPRT